ncbi:MULTISPECIES: hypothetical protein [Klebsiella]|nr:MULTISPECIES: hypothetical protein [Klebsiella]EMB9109491.1 hypothetical protein [Klebsiella quasipneumoniae]EME4041094.1 hypothetical protein [Klebsiella quasipneumoniae]MBC4923299.1 hypothetical protein [Klebsiella quasipneumoniae]MBF7779862.1 hypothetical protein [Klebsiella quasipneumoniae]MCH9421089.1 hypothetical protein [Klebsiella quasipneumoniae]
MMGVNNHVFGDAGAVADRESTAQNGLTNAAGEEKIDYHQQDNAHAEGKE